MPHYNQSCDWELLLRFVGYPLSRPFCVYPYFDTIVRIADSLDVTRDDLTGRTEAQTPPKIRN